MPSRLRFPFLVLGRRQGAVLEHLRVASHPDFAVSFSSIRRASEFLTSRGESNWEFTLVSRVGMEVLIADLRAEGLKGLCQDVEPDGTCSALLSLDALESLFCR